MCVNNKRVKDCDYRSHSWCSDSILVSFASFCLLAAAVPVLEKDVTKYLSGLDIRDAVISVGAFALTFLLAKWLIEKILKFFRIA